MKSEGASPPHSVEAANRLFREGRLADAEEAYNQLLKQKPHLAWVFCRLGEIRLKEGNRAAAQQQFEKALALNPKLEDALRGLHQVREGTAPAAPAIETENASRKTFWKQFKQANTLLEQRNLSRAETIFRDLLALEPANAFVLSKLGRIEGEYGHQKEAIALYDRAIAADAVHVPSYMGRAEILETSGDLEAAMQDLATVLRLEPAATVAASRLEIVRKKRDLAAQRSDGVEIFRWPAQTARAPGDGPKVAVVAWCLAHNPVGRALVLADVAKHSAVCEIVGPIFSSYGEDLWEPLRASARNVDIRGFVARSFATFMEGAIRLVLEKPCDVAWVSKPRLPSLLIGFLYKLIHGASVVLDIDDDELAFVRADTPLSFAEFVAEQTPSDWREPHSMRWTQLAASMTGLADAVTSCNPVLQRKFGGTLIRHARGEETFVAARAKRDALRAEFGFSEADKVVLFLGTPRRHKGVLDVARALRDIGDPNAVFCVIGTVRDKELMKELEALKSVRMALYPDQPYSRIADLNAMADVVCILQDPANPIAQSQTPAKLTDAIATGTTVLATNVPPIADLIADGHIVPVQDGELVEALRSALSGAFENETVAEARRAFFRNELSTAANAERAREVLALARSSNKPMPHEIAGVLRHIDTCMPGSIPADCAAALKGILSTGPRIGRLQTLRENVNLVFFWKQNDSGIFGRRQDMLLKQFAAMPNIKRILHIDAPISADALAAQANGGQATGPGRFIASNTIGRFLGTLDDDKVARRTFVYRGKDTHFLGRELWPVEAFPNLVEQWLHELDMTRNVMAWVCPVVRGFPEVQRRLGFSFIASDVIDDQRQWPMQPAWRVQIEKSYRDTFAASDAAFANCEPVADWLRSEGLRPLVVANGMDAPESIETWQPPAALKDLSRPVIGYCGSLTHRIDWDLIEAVATARPEWSFVLIGEPARDEQFARIAARPNIHVLGVLPYATAARHIAAFDVAMVPHTRTALSEHMNPLKLYVYRSLGVPVVSTAIANIGDFAGDIRIADTPERFIAEAGAALAERQRHGRSFPPQDMMQTCSWESRAAKIMAHLQDTFESTQASGVAA